MYYVNFLIYNDSKLKDFNCKQFFNYLTSLFIYNNKLKKIKKYSEYKNLKKSEQNCGLLGKYKHFNKVFYKIINHLKRWNYKQF